MYTHLRILNVEDSVRDASLLKRHLTNAGYDLVWDRVESAPDLRTALTTKEWDLILCDYSMPRFSAVAALAVLREFDLDIPFIIISGTIGEEIAVEALLTGANDYIPKGNLTRLVPAIKRELVQAENRRAKRQAEDDRRRSDARYRALFEYAPDGIIISGPDNYYLDANASMCAMLGYSHTDLIGMHASDIIIRSEARDLDFEFTLVQSTPDYNREWHFRRKDGSVFPGEVIATIMPDGNLLAMIRDISGRKEAEEKLSQSQSNLARAQQIARLGSWEMDLPLNGNGDASPLRWSDEVFRIFGYRPGEIEVSNENFFKAAHPDDREDIRAAMAKALKAGDTYNVDHRILLPDGTERIVHEHSELVSDEITGEPLKMIGTVQDITERRRIEEQLAEAAASNAESLALIDTILANAPIGFAFQDCDLRYVRINKTLAAINGRSVEHHLGRTLLEILPAMSPILDPIMRRVIKTGKPVVDFEFSGETQAEPGLLKHWLVSFYPVRMKGGEVLGVGVLVSEVTERKKAEDELRESEERFAGAFELAPIGVALVLPDGKWLKVNRALCEITGYTESELLEMTFQDITHADDVRSDVLNSRRLLRGKIAHYQMEKRYIHKLGHIVFVSINVSLVRDGDGKPLYFIAQIQDVTDRKRAEEELRESEYLLASSQRITHLGSWVINLDAEGKTHTEHWSDEHYRIYGFKPGEIEITEEVFFNSVHPDDRERLASTVRESIEHKKPFNTEHRIILPDGSERTVHAVAEVVLDDKTGRALKLLGSVQDITDRKRAEEALLASEERFRFLNELSDATRSLTDPVQIMTVMSRMLGEHLQASRCAYAHMDSDGEKFTIPYDYTDGCASTVGSYDLSLFGTKAVATLNSEQTLVIRDVDAELLAEDGAEMFNAIGIRAIITCPLVKDGGLRALMAVHQTAPRDWTPGEVALVQDVVERCWATIERITAEDSLRESDEKFHQLADHITDVFWIRSPDMNTIHYISPAYEKIWGRTIEVDYANPHEWYDFIVPVDRQRVQETYAALMGAAPNIEIEYRIIRADGEMRWVRARGFQVRDAEGRLIRLAGIVTDITESKEAIEALGESEERNRELVENAIDIIYTHDLEGTYTSVNKAGERITGYTHDESVAMNIADTVAPEYIAKARKMIAEKLAGNEITAYEIELIAKDGHRVSLEVNTRIIYDDNVPVGVQGIARDITERKKVQAALRESEERYRDLVENAIDVIYTLDLEGNYTSMNRAGEGVTGYTVEESLKRNIVESMAPEYRERAKQLLAAQVHGEDLSAFELEIVAKDGHRVALEIKTRPIKENGVPVGIQGIARDISERKRAEREIKMLPTMMRIGLVAVLVLAGVEFVQELLENTVGFWLSVILPLIFGVFAATAISYFAMLRQRAMHRRTLEEIAERKRTQSALEDSDASFKSLFDTANDAIMVLNEGLFIDCNARTEAMFGCTKDWIIGRGPVELSPPIQPDGRTSEEKVLLHIVPAMQGTPQFFEWQHMRKDGTLFDAEVSLNKVDFQGETHVQAIVRDVTERKRADAELRESHRRVEDIVNSVEGIVWEADAQTFVFSFVSTQAEQILGYPSRRWIDEPTFWSEHIHPDDRDGAVKFCVDSTNKLMPHEFEYRMLADDGRYVWIKDTVTVLAEDGRAVKIRGIMMDITDRKKAETQLIESKEQLTLAAESVNLGVWDWDVVENKLAWDDRMYELYGIREEDFGGAYDAWQKGLHPDDRKIGDDNIKAALAGERPFSNEFRVVWPNGETHNIEARALVKFDGSGKALRMIGVNWDITGRMQLEEQYRQSQKMEAVGVLAGGIAHDFNNLLTAINGYSDLTLKKMAPDDPLRRHIEEVKNAGSRAAELTSQLLAFSRKQVLRTTVLSLNTVISNIEKMLRRIIRESVELRVILDPDLGNVKGDAGQIEQVIMNLAINARDAMPDGGTLTIRTQNIFLDDDYASRHLAVTPGEFIKLTVTDTGEGMDAAVQSHIFEPFFTTKDVDKGTGLGLATVYGIVKQSGGDIEVYSEVGHGTTFKIYLPSVDESVKKARWTGERERPSRGTETVLVVEDEEIVRKLVCEVLTSDGYTVLEASEAKAALEIVETYGKTIHLLLTDVIMPKIGGSELKDHIVKLRPDIKVLFMSGYTDDAIAHRGIYDADIAFIEKPFTPNVLLRKIRSVLEISDK